MGFQHHPYERALRPLPLAEEIDPDVFDAYHAGLSARSTAENPALQYQLLCNTLDKAIAIKSGDLADQAYEGLSDLAHSQNSNLAVPPFACVRMALSFEAAMRQRIARTSPTREIRASTYHALAELAGDILTHPTIVEDHRQGYLSELLVLGGLLHPKSGPFPYFSLAREENNKLYGSGNHDFYILDNGSYKGGKKPWNVKTHSGSTPAPPVRNIYVSVLVSSALMSHPRERRNAINYAKNSEKRHRGYIRYMARVMVRNYRGESNTTEDRLFSTFSELAARAISKADPQIGASPDNFQSNIGDLHGDALRGIQFLETT